MFVCSVVVIVYQLITCVLYAFFFYRVWSLIFTWLGIDGVSHLDGINHFLQHGSFLKVNT